MDCSWEYSSLISLFSTTCTCAVATVSVHMCVCVDIHDERNKGMVYVHCMHVCSYICMVASSAAVSRKIHSYVTVLICSKFYLLFLPEIPKILTHYSYFIPT